MKIKPADPNAIIRDPHTKVPLPAEGAEVPDDHIHWNRMLIDGSCVRCEEPASPPVVNAPIAPLNTRGGRS